MNVTSSVFIDESSGGVVVFDGDLTVSAVELVTNDPRQETITAQTPVVVLSESTSTTATK